MTDRTPPEKAPASKAPRSKSDASGWVKEQGRSVVVPSFDFRVDFAAASATGVGRSVNQDALLCRADLGLFAIADGMGGHAAGEIASRVSLEVIDKTLKSSRARSAIQAYAADPELENRREVFSLLHQALRDANEAVIKAGENDESRKGMGTTCDLVLLVRDRAFFAHVGDSRAYLVRPTALLQLTNDHAAYDSLRTSGKRNPTRRFNRSPLTNSIGHRRRVVVDTLFVDLAAGDRILLCTDGVFNAVDGEPIFAKTARTGDVDRVCEQLIRNARDQGDTDDASMIVIRVKDRFAKRRGDAGPRARDMATISSSPLMADLEPHAVLSTLAAGVELELDVGDEIPRAVANDRVAYIILEGLVELPNGRTLGGSGMLMIESLLDVASRGKLPKVAERARLLRIRHDDFNQVCAHNTALAAELYKRIARHLATNR
jgi:serine/threonine protein phosphatase PrpC